MENKKHDVLSDVQCTVESCVHHCCDNSCAAPGITVKQDCGDCTCKSETLCSTYQRHE